MIPKIKLVSFDAADTLIKLARSIGEQYAAVASKFGVIAEAQSLDKSFKKVFAATPPLGTDGNKGFSWWKEVIRKTFSEVGFETEAFSHFDLFAEELYDYLSQDNTWVAYPDAEPTLKQLQSLGLRMIVFSNFDERLIKVLQELKLEHYFEKIICSTQIGLAKPDPRAFAKVAELVDLKPQNILHVGDGFENDYLAALRANMKALYLNRKGIKAYTMVNDKYEISSLLEAFEFLNG